MKPIYLLITLFSVIPFFSKSQNIRLEISPYSQPEFLSKPEHSLFPVYNISKAEGNAMYYKYRNKKIKLKEYFSVKKMTLDAKLIWNFDIPRLDKKQDSKIDIIEVISEDAVLICVWSQAFYKEKTGELRIFKLKKSDGSLLSAKSFCQGAARDGTIMASKNGMFLSINRAQFPKEKNKKHYHFRTIINSNLEVIQSYSYESSRLGNYFWGVNDQGLGVECVANPDDRDLNLRTYQLGLLKTNTSFGSQLSKNKFLTFSFTQTNLGTYVASLIEGDSKNTTNKVHLVKFSSSLTEFKHMTSIDLSKEQVEEYYKNLDNRSVRWKEPPVINSTLRRLHLNQIEEDSKGNLYVFLQGSKLVTSEYPGPFYYGTNYFILKDDLLMKFNNEGVYEWGQIFFRHGHSTYYNNGTIHFNNKLDCLEMVSSFGSEKTSNTTYSQYDISNGNEILFKRFPGVYLFESGSAHWKGDYFGLTCTKLNSNFNRNYGTQWMLIDFNE